MDHSNWRPTHPGEEPTMEMGDWRAQLPPGLRQQILNKITEALKKQISLSGPEGINELKRNAATFEENVFTNATNQTDYLRKIAQKILNMEAMSQKNASVSSTSVSTANSSMPLDSALLDSTTQTEKAHGDDWQEEVYQKITSMKEMYLPELNELYQRFVAKMQQFESFPQQQRSDHYEKLRKIKTILERMMAFLAIPKSSIIPDLKDKVGSYEKEIISFLNLSGSRKQLQQGQLPQSQVQPQSQMVLDQSHDNASDSVERLCSKILHDFSLE